MTAPDASTVTFYRRPLPEGLIAFASPLGRQVFQEALAQGGLQGWFALAEQFHTQSDPAFCGLGSLVVALNALEIDPGRIWKGPWRWYSEELLDCCLPLEEVRNQGVTMGELACLARCNGADARAWYADGADVSALREAVVQAATSPRGPILIASYTRRVLGQTGDGHFSPVAGYHAERDLALLLDVARFKYPPHWVPLSLLHQAMTPADASTGRSRGWIMLDRNQHASALLFRIVNQENAQALASALFNPPSESAQPPANNFAEDFSMRMGKAAADWMSRAAAGVQSLPFQHRDAVQSLRAQLHLTKAFALVRHEPGTEWASAEALAMLLLAMPDTLVKLWRIPESLRQQIHVDPSHMALAAEVESLRNQLDTLFQWRQRGSAGTCLTNMSGGKC